MRSVCLGWLCASEYRYSCIHALREGDGMHIRFFVPLNKGEFCEHYEPIEDEEDEVDA